MTISRRGSAPLPSPANVIAGVALAINIGALIWGAAKITAAVDQLQITTRDLGQIVQLLSREQADLRARLGIIEDRQKRGR